MTTTKKAIMGGAAFLILLIIIVIATSGDESGTGGGAASVPPTPTPAPLGVTVQQIYDEYQANEARANVTYKERPLSVSFTVDEIEDDHVTHQLPGLASAQLEFEEDVLITFDVGDKRTAVCELRGLDLDIWLRFDCR